MLGDDGAPVGTESFRCAPGPMGWRYFSDVDTTVPSPHHEIVDVAVDNDWRVARIRIDTGDHQLLLEPRDEALSGFRDGAPVEIEYGTETHVNYYTPATSLITTKRLAGTSEIDVVRLAPLTLEPRRVRHRFEMHETAVVTTPSGRFAATRWTFTALDDGRSADFWVCGDIVVAYDRLFELAWYEAGASGVRTLP